LKQAQQDGEANEPNPDVHEPSPGTGLGERLVRAREAKGLTLSVVASKLRLSAATLQALESDRYEDLPEPIFVRGYLRAYARLLEMDQKVLIAAYDRLGAKGGPVLTPTTRVRRQATARTRYVGGAGALIVVAIVVLLGSWWYSRLKHDVPAQSQTVSSEAEPPASPAPVLPPPRIDSKNQNPGPAVAFPPDIPPQPPATEAAEERVAVVEPKPQMAETAAMTEPALPVVSASSVTANADAVVQRRDVEATVEPAVPDLSIAPLASEHRRLVKASRAPTGEDVLVIQANDESWAEVVDANGYQLLYYPLRPGMVCRLQGQAPFQVFLGNAPAVDLSLNQKRFDHTPFQRRNRTARFTVEEDSRSHRTRDATESSPPESGPNPGVAFGT
jgi:cytoskeleton protein RodZ